MSRVRIDPATLSDLVVYADESGDHGLDVIDPDYPVFALAFVIMTRDAYVDVVTPALQRLKFSYWGHDQVAFHEREIRKRVGPFAMLADPATNASFISDLSGLIEAAPFHLCVAVIDKAALKQKYVEPWSPYEIALCFCMEQLLNCVRQHPVHPRGHQPHARDVPEEGGGDDRTRNFYQVWLGLLSLGGEFALESRKPLVVEVAANKQRRRLL